MPHTWSPKEDASLMAWAAKWPNDRPSHIGELKAELGWPVSVDAASSRLRRLIPTWRPKKGIDKGREGVQASLSQLQTQAQLKDLQSAHDHLLRELADRDRQIEALTALSDAPAAPIKDTRPRGEVHSRRGVPILLCSDWHVEEGVEPAKVGDLNRYNLAIAERCIAELGEAFEWLTHDSRFDCREGVIWLGGDLFSGYIHDELQEGNFLSPVQAVVWLQDKIERLLRWVLAHTKFERIRVVCNDGNHGRLTHKIRVATRTANSLEWLLYQTLAIRFDKEKRLVWQIADGEYNYLPIYGKVHAFAHGDSFKYGGGVGGLLIPIRRGFNEIRKYRRIDNLYLGHFHQRTDDGEIMVNGSMIGITPYSMSKQCKPEGRQQSFCLIDSERGKCISAPVWLPQK